MLPKLNIFGLSISTYYLMMFLGFVLMLVLMLVHRKRYGIGTPKAILFTVFVMFSGVLGCKVLYILENLKDTFENGVSLGGFSFFGAVFLVSVLMIGFGKLLKMPVKTSLDASAICVCAMIGTIRVGCFFNGCCGGLMTRWGFRWPTQAIESICDFMLLFFLLQFAKQPKFKGALYPILMTVYSAYRFLIEFLRDTPRTALGLANGHFFALGGMIVGTVWLLILHKRKKTNAALS